MSVKHIHSNSYIPLILLVALFVGVLAIIVRSTEVPQELRQKAATPTGTEVLTLSPPSDTYQRGQLATITLLSSFTNIPLDGIQSVISIQGTIPSDFTFTPASITGLTLAKNTLSTTDSGKLLELIFVSANPETPYLQQGLQTLGTFKFTSPGSGSLTISYNTTLTKIVQNQTTQDVAAIPKSGTYKFITLTRPPPASPAAYLRDQF